MKPSKYDVTECRNNRPMFVANVLNVTLTSTCFKCWKRLQDLGEFHNLGLLQVMLGVSGPGPGGGGGGGGEPGAGELLTVTVVRDEHGYGMKVSGECTTTVIMILTLLQSTRTELKITSQVLTMQVGPSSLKLIYV